MVTTKSKEDETQDKEIMELRLNMVTLQTDVKYTKEKVNLIERKLDKFIDCSDKKYAGKKVEIQTETNTKDISRLKVNMAKYIGYASGVVAVITFLINKFF